MKCHDMLQILNLFAALMFAAADTLAGMDQAIAVIPQRAVRVVQISEQANTIAQTTFNPAVAADFKAKYAALLQTEKDIGADISNIVGLSGQINGLHQQTLVRKLQEEANINNLNAQIHRMAADVNANEQHLANLNADLANAEGQLAEAEHKLEEAKKKKRKNRKRKNKLLWIPRTLEQDSFAHWFRRLIDHFKKERQLRDSLMDNRNQVAAARDQSNNQKQHLQNQLTAAQHIVAVNNNLLHRINSFLNRGNVAKEQLTGMHLYLGRLHPHMEVINKNLELVDQLAEKTPADFTRILKDSLATLQTFNNGQLTEIAKFQQIVG